MFRPNQFLITIFLIIVPLLLWGQDYTVMTKEIGIEDEFIGSRVRAIHEDSKGFIWLITLSGLARYDGHQIKWFTKSNSDIRAIPSQTQLTEDNEGYLWLINNGQLDLLHTSTFEVVHGEEKFKSEFPEGLSVSNLKIGKNGEICFRLADKEEYYIYHSSRFTKLPFIKKINNVFVDDDIIWATQLEKDWKKYDIKTGKILAQVSTLEGKKYIFPIYNYPLEGDWFSTYNEKLKEVHVLKVHQNKVEIKAKIPSSKSINFKYHAQSELLIGNFQKDNGKGLFALDLNWNLKYIKPAKANLNLKGKIAYINNQGILWSLPQRGLRLYQIQKSTFTSYAPYESTRGLRVDDTHLWSEGFRTALNNPAESIRISNMNRKGFMRCIEHNIKDEFWFGGSFGIIHYDAKKEEIISQIACQKDVEGKAKNIWSILRDKEGTWWAGTRSRGVLRCLPNEDSLQLYHQFNELADKPRRNIVHLLEDGKYIWACTGIGLFLIDKTKGQSYQYSSDVSPPFQLPTDQVHFIHKDKNNDYWVATATDGLVRFRLNEKKEILEKQQFGIEDGLPSLILYAILEDDNERLWISTSNGISCYDKKKKTFQNFGRIDGINQLEFNRISYAKGLDGRLYFGSLSGVFGFHPDEVLQKEVYELPIYVTNFSVYEKQNQQLTDRTEELLQTKKIILKPNDRLFRLNVVMLDFFNAEALKYTYKIEGLFKDYQTMEGNIIEIGGLPYGRYTLKVRGQGVDGRFSKQELSYELIVVKPFYLRWWFIIIMFITLVISAMQIYYWRIQQLQDRKKELETLVNQRTAQIQKQAIQLKELDELKSKFFANISHELRTPLTLILAPLESVLKSNELSNKNSTYLQMMRQNGQKLLKRINELLDLSRLDANRLEVNEKATFLYPFFKTLVATFESAANIKDIQLLFTFELDENIQVLLDENKVEKILTNFLSNALKFTPKKGRISCKIIKNKNNLEISVTDTGIGILSNDLIKIFDRFYQTQKSNQQEGTGIGLSLCRELAKVLNGKVWATSEIGKGTTFFLELPLVETFVVKEPITEEEAIIATPIIHQEKAASTAQKYRPNILIVEDNPDLSTYLSMILEEDYNVEVVENGKEAWERLQACLPRDDKQVASSDLQGNSAVSSTNSGANPQQERSIPQLIVSDIMMPIMDGIELLTKVKSSKELQPIPVIMLTARQSMDIKLDALRIGVDDYLTKPFKEEELKARVRNLIQNSQNRVEPKDDISNETIITKSISTSDLKWLEEAETIIIEHIADSSFKLTDVASALAISYRRFQQKMKKITGLTPKQYQRSIKLNKARELFKSGQVQTVTEVMYRCGFEHHNYFSKLYKEEFGVMPSEELKK